MHKLTPQQVDNNTAHNEVLKHMHDAIFAGHTFSRNDPSRLLTLEQAEELQIDTSTRAVTAQTWQISKQQALELVSLWFGNSVLVDSYITVENCAYTVTSNNRNTQQLLQQQFGSPLEHRRASPLLQICYELDRNLHSDIQYKIRTPTQAQELRSQGIEVKAYLSNKETETRHIYLPL